MNKISNRNQMVQITRTPQKSIKKVKSGETPAQKIKRLQRNVTKNLWQAN
jgi:hypothetical protein